eukprot:8032223-Heterocapsa_arctica.AAC.1
MDRLFFGNPTPAKASGKAEPSPPELIENMKDKQRIMELEALLRRPCAECIAVSTTPVPASAPASERSSGATSFATPREVAAPTRTAAHLAAPP